MEGCGRGRLKGEREREKERERENELRSQKLVPSFLAAQGNASSDM